MTAFSLGFSLSMRWIAESTSSKRLASPRRTSSACAVASSQAPVIAAVTASAYRRGLEPSLDGRLERRAALQLGVRLDHSLGLLAHLVQQIGLEKRLHGFVGHAVLLRPQQLARAAQAHVLLG